jgi:hypothetical protein
VLAEARERCTSNRDNSQMFRSLVQAARGPGGTSGGADGGTSLGPGEGTMSGPGSGSPVGTSGAGISCGVGGRITSGAGAGLGSLGWGVGMLPRFVHGNATGRAFVPAAEGGAIEACPDFADSRQIRSFAADKSLVPLLTAIALPEWLVIRAWLGARGL